MPNSKSYLPKFNGRFAFFKEFLKHPMQIGSIIPSSRYLEEKILEASSLDTTETVVELGSGTGGTTKAILSAMNRQAKLLSIEINPRFHAMVSKIKDDRLIAHLGSACDLSAILDHYQLTAPTVVISGIPFSTMGPTLGSQVMQEITSALADDGRFIAYQVSTCVASICQPFMGKAEVVMELRNIPPMRVYRWEKKNHAAMAHRKLHQHHGPHQHHHS